MSHPAPASEAVGESITFVTVINDFAEFHHNLGASAVRRSERHQWIEFDNIANRASSDICRLYCDGLARAEHDLVFFIHPDVYLPGPWEAQAFEGLRQVEAVDPSWGVIGAAGNLPPGFTGDQARGHWADPQQQEDCFHGPLPSEVFSLDECWLGVRKSRAVSFDRVMPGFHCYGVDLCLSARERGMRSWAIDAFIWHKFKDPKGNRIISAATSKKIQQRQSPAFQASFEHSHAYIRRKWRAHLPMRSMTTAFE